MKRWLRAGTALALVPALTAAQCELAYLTGDQPGDKLGSSLDVNNGRMIAAMPGLSGNAGGARVYRRDGDDWVTEATLGSFFAGSGQGFGSAVALGQNLAFIGAIHKGGTGSVLWYTRSGTTWTEQWMTELTPTGASTFALFGTSLAFGTDTLVVGAPGDGPSSRGSAFVFRRIAGVWTQEAKLEPLVSNTTDFGASVAFTGNYAFIGSPSENGGTGAVHVFQRSGSVWTEVQKLSGDTAIDNFGTSVDATGGDRLIVGIPLQDDPFANAGSAQIYARSGSNWILDQVLTASDPLPQNQFGSSVSISGDLALVGSFNSPLFGAAYLFEDEAGTWSESAKLTGSLGAAGDDFGRRVAIQGQDLAASTTTPGSAGAVYAYALDGPDLCGAPSEISVTLGGTQSFQIDAGVANAGKIYWLLGSFSGTSPGFVQNGWTIPLNPVTPSGATDPFFLASLTGANLPPWSMNNGFLDAEGKASASFTILAGQLPTLAGITAHHAYIVLTGTTVEYASSPVELNFIQ